MIDAALKRRRLGRTSLMVPPIGFGGAPLRLLNYLIAADREASTYRAEAAAAIQVALWSGLTFCAGPDQPVLIVEIRCSYKADVRPNT